jgi:MarR family transcriptional regulator, organic hydroperoxide resistance regulator
MNQGTQVETLDFILANICHLHRTRVYQLFDALGLYQGQPPVLFELWKQQGLTQTELAARLKITPATITRMLQRMERSGFIRREPDPLDQRVSRVFLTDAGIEIKSRVEKVWQTLEAEQFCNFSPQEIEQLRGLLLQLRSNLLQVTGEEPWK